MGITHAHTMHTQPVISWSRTCLGKWNKSPHLVNIMRKKQQEPENTPMCPYNQVSCSQYKLDNSIQLCSAQLNSI